MPRQGALRSPSSRRETTAENLHAKRVGCMSGVLHLVWKHQSRRKFLTFAAFSGKKKEKNAIISAASKSEALEFEKEDHQKGEEATCRRRISSCDVPRSPTLPASIRRRQAESDSETADQKRRMVLMGALEKCDRDLKALQSIIQAVQEEQNLRTRSLSAFEDEIRMISESKRCFSGEAAAMNGGKIVNGVQQQPMIREFGTPSPLCIYTKQHGTRFYGREQKHQGIRKKPAGEDDIINLYFFDRIQSESSYQRKKREEDAAGERSPLWSSKAMAESVEEVCRDIAWGESRELGRIGLALQDYICRDLVEDIVRELGCFCMFNSLPFEACKRRLSF